MPIKIIAERSIPHLDKIPNDLLNIEFIASHEFTNDRVRKADALIVRSITRCNEKLLHNTNIKLICTATAGYDHIDTNYCECHGITWRNSPGCNAKAVAQYVIGSLAHLAIQLHESIRGRCIGIVGVGNVGKEVERFACALGFKVLLCDPPRAKTEGQTGFVSFEEILSLSDIITLHVPLTTDGTHPTYHLVNHQALDLIARKPILINASRGAVTNTATLIEGRRRGLFKRIIVDCWENEPNINLALLSMADIATPHIAGFSADGKSNGTRMCLENIRDFYGINIPNINLIIPEVPENPFIDLSFYDDPLRIFGAINHSFDPTKIDRKLRESPKNFEGLRKAYHYPREMSAYTVVGATPLEESTLRQLDFLTL